MIKIPLRTIDLKYDGSGSLRLRYFYMKILTSFLSFCSLCFLIQTSRAVLQAGVTTLKKNMVIRKKAELDEMDVQLALKRHEFKRCMGALATRRSELETKQQQVSQGLGSGQLLTSD